MRCEECGAEADENARGWRALPGEEDDGELIVAQNRCGSSASRVREPPAASEIHLVLRQQAPSKSDLLRSDTVVKQLVNGPKRNISADPVRPIPLNTDPKIQQLV